MLAYLLGDEGGYCFIISGQGQPRVEKLELSAERAKALGIKAGQLTAVRAQAVMQVGGKPVHELLSHPVKAYDAVPRLALLWELLVPEEVRRDLVGGKIDNLIVVPDGPLCNCRSRRWWSKTAT